jgi:hypothetical protein
VRFAIGLPNLASENILELKPLFTWMQLCTNFVPWESLTRSFLWVILGSMNLPWIYELTLAFKNTLEYKKQTNLKEFRFWFRLDGSP